MASRSARFLSRQPDHVTIDDGQTKEADQAAIEK
jgi:hypothetical protein